MKKIIGAQGEITIIQIDAIPENVQGIAVERAPGGWIISHSEKGNHHLLTGGEVMERTKDVPAGMKILYAILEQPEKLIQDATDAHGAHNLPAGLYEFRIAREYDPFAAQARIVTD